MILKDTIHSKLILLESAIFQGREPGRQGSIEEAYAELMNYLEGHWVYRAYRGLFRKRWNL